MANKTWNAEKGSESLVAHIGVKPPPSLNFPVSEQVKPVSFLKVVLFLSSATQKPTVTLVNIQRGKQIFL